MYIFICFDSFLHHLIDIVNILSHVLPNICIKRKLVLLELAFLFI